MPKEKRKREKRSLALNKGANLAQQPGAVTLASLWVAAGGSSAQQLCFLRSKMYRFKKIICPCHTQLTLGNNIGHQCLVQKLCRVNKIFGNYHKEMKEMGENFTATIVLRNLCRCSVKVVLFVMSVVRKWIVEQ
jgi:hypothetical protein